MDFYHYKRFILFREGAFCEIVQIVHRRHYGLGVQVRKSFQVRVEPLPALYYPANVAGFPNTISADGNDLAGFETVIRHRLIALSIVQSQRRAGAVQLFKSLGLWVLEYGGVMAGLNPLRALLLDLQGKKNQG